MLLRRWKHADFEEIVKLMKSLLETPLMRGGTSFGQSAYVSFAIAVIPTHSNAKFPPKSHRPNQYLLWVVYAMVQNKKVVVACFFIVVASVLM